jgi:hypothetical protein
MGLFAQLGFFGFKIKIADEINSSFTNVKHKAQATHSG